MVIADQLSKAAASSLLTEGIPAHVISIGDTDILTFSLYKNTGAAFSSFQGKTFMLTIVTVLFLCGIIYYIVRYKPGSRLLLICLAMIEGGGNLIDRVKQAYVVDFIHLWPFNFIFNVADIFVVFGTILLFIYFFFFDKKDDKKNAAVKENE